MCFLHKYSSLKVFWVHCTHCKDGAAENWFRKWPWSCNLQAQAGRIKIKKKKKSRSRKKKKKQTIILQLQQPQSCCQMSVSFQLTLQELISLLSWSPFWGGRENQLRYFFLWQCFFSASHCISLIVLSNT